MIAFTLARLVVWIFINENDGKPNIAIANSGKLRAL